MNDYKNPTEMMEQMAAMIKASMPQVKPSKNGFEIRTKVLDFAQAQVWQDYHAKWGQFETSVEKTSSGQIVTSIKMPDVPSADAVLETANKFYEFVSNNKSKD